MKTYKLSTGNGVNEMNVHFRNESEMIFNTLEDAIKAFNIESQELKDTYQSFYNATFVQDEVKESDLVSCRLQLLIDGELIFEGEGLEIEEKYTSEIFFM